MKSIRFVIPAVIVIAIGGIGYQLFTGWKHDMELIREARARLEQADPAALLAACDSLFTNPVAKHVRWQEVTPQVIQDLQPLNVEISPDYIHVPLKAPCRIGFWCVPEGVAPPQDDTNSGVKVWEDRLFMYVE